MIKDYRYRNITKSIIATLMFSLPISSGLAAQYPIDSLFNTSKEIIKTAEANLKNDKNRTNASKAAFNTIVTELNTQVAKLLQLQEAELNSESILFKLGEIYKYINILNDVNNDSLDAISSVIERDSNFVTTINLFTNRIKSNYEFEKNALISQIKDLISQTNIVETNLLKEKSINQKLHNEITDLLEKNKTLRNQLKQYKNNYELETLISEENTKLKNKLEDLRKNNTDKINQLIKDNKQLRKILHNIKYYRIRKDSIILDSTNSIKRFNGLNHESEESLDEINESLNSINKKILGLLSKNAPSSINPITNNFDFDNTNSEKENDELTNKIITINQPIKENEELTNKIISFKNNEDKINQLTKENEELYELIRLRVITEEKIWKKINTIKDNNTIGRNSIKIFYKIKSYLKRQMVINQNLNKTLEKSFNQYKTIKEINPQEENELLKLKIYNKNVITQRDNLNKENELLKKQIFSLQSSNRLLDEANKYISTERDKLKEKNENLNSKINILNKMVNKKRIEIDQSKDLQLINLGKQIKELKQKLDDVQKNNKDLIQNESQLRQELEEKNLQIQQMQQMQQMQYNYNRIYSLALQIENNSFYARFYQNNYFFIEEIPFYLYIKKLDEEGNICPEKRENVLYKRSDNTLYFPKEPDSEDKVYDADIRYTKPDPKIFDIYGYQDVSSEIENNNYLAQQTIINDQESLINELTKKSKNYALIALAWKNAKENNPDKDFIQFIAMMNNPATKQLEEYYLLYDIRSNHLELYVK